MLNVSVHRLMGIPLLAAGVSLMSGCSRIEPNTFSFIVDMPPGFKYKAVVYYIPAPGETCTVARKDNKATVYNYRWWEEYTASIEIKLKRTINDCPLIMRSVRLEMYSVYGKESGDFGADNAFIFLRDEQDDGYKMWNKPFDAAGVTLVEGQCQSLFRTSGKPRILRKLLSCKNINAQGVLENQVPTGAYTFEQLAGKTVKLKLTWAAEDRPAGRDKWVKFPNGWKRCMGKSFEDPYAFCRGNHTDFSHFIMPDGRRCTIYPGCTERKENE